MSTRRYLFTARVLLIVGIAAGLCVAGQRYPLSAQELNQPGPVEAAARPATVDNPVPRLLSVKTPPEGVLNLLRRASLQGYSGAVLLKVTLDGSGRVAEARAIGLALSGPNPSTHRVVQDDPLPSAEQMFAPDEAMARAALDLITYARQSAQQHQYQPPIDGPLSFHDVVVSTNGRLTIATMNGPADLRDVFPPSAVTSSESPRFATTGPSAPVMVRSTRWDPTTSSPASTGTATAGAAQAPPAAQTATSAAASPRPSTAQTTGGVAGPGAANIAAGTSAPSAPTPPRAATAATPLAPVRVGGNVMAPRKLKDVKPVYPAAAQSDRVQGIVIIEATIDASGKVTNARVLRSIALLDDAALDAVKQWEFEPTRLNGVPVPIVMSVTVNFTLAPSPAQ